MNNDYELTDEEIVGVAKKHPKIKQFFPGKEPVRRYLLYLQRKKLLEAMAKEGTLYQEHDDESHWYGDTFFQIPEAYWKDMLTAHGVEW